MPGRQKCWTFAPALVSSFGVSQKPQGPPRRMPKILVVDDQRNMRTTLAMMLRGAGYEVDEAADGAQGVDLGAKGAYDVVVTDLRMGPIDGLAVLLGVKEAHAMTQGIVITAYGTIA